MKLNKINAGFSALFVAGYLALQSASAVANVVITGTRVIYPSDQKNVLVKLDNQSKNAALVQAWIDEGDPNADPKKVKVPFVITPPVTRIEANTGQTLRVMFTGGDSLPKDRESLFYFNLLDIPPKPSKEFLQKSPNFLQLAIRSRLKLFYRPAELSITPNDAYQAVKWKVVPNGIQVENQTPYYLSYVGASINNVKAKNVKMVAPFSQATFEVKGAAKGKTVKWQLVNDFGGDTSGEAVLQ